MLNKNECYEIEIFDMDENGRGIGRAEGMVVFVRDCVIGDLVLAEITGVKKNLAFGRTVDIIRPSEYRIEPDCPIFGDCGGCSLACLSYEGQLDFKERKVRDCLERIGKVDNPEIEDILYMEEPVYYRNNGQFAVGGTTEEPAVGFFRSGTHEVIDSYDCLLQSEPAVTVAQIIREYIVENGVSVYDEATGEGALRHVIIRSCEGTGEVMVVLVVNRGKLPELEDLGDWIAEGLAGIEVEQAIAEIANAAAEDDAAEVEADFDREGEYAAAGNFWKLRCLALNVNQGKTGGAVMGDKTIFLYGQERIMDDFEGINYLISPASFYQVNTKQAKRLYAVVKDYAELTGSETVFDLYCGVGTISLYLAKSAKRVIGIESVKAAVLDANRNAIKNGVVNAVFTCAKAEEALPKMVEKGTRAHAAVLDPPRKGCDRKLLEAVAAAGVDRIVYVSCNPSTMARDVKLLKELGYSFIKAQPVDMFPHTVEVECVVQLKKCIDF